MSIEQTVEVPSIFQGIALYRNAYTLFSHRYLGQLAHQEQVFLEVIMHRDHGYPFVLDQIVTILVEKDPSFYYTLRVSQVSPTVSHKVFDLPGNEIKELKRVEFTGTPVFPEFFQDDSLPFPDNQRNGFGDGLFFSVTENNLAPAPYRGNQLRVIPFNVRFADVFVDKSSPIAPAVFAASNAQGTLDSDLGGTL